MLAPPPFVYTLRMADANVGYLVGGRQTDVVFRLYRTGDGGRSWTDVTPPGARPDGGLATFGRTVFVGPRANGVVVIERSGDGGRSWVASAPLPDRRPATPGPVVRAGPHRLYVLLDEGAAAGSNAQSLWRSDDG